MVWAGTLWQPPRGSEAEQFVPGGVSILQHLGIPNVHSQSKDLSVFQVHSVVAQHRSNGNHEDTSGTDLNFQYPEERDPTPHRVSVLQNYLSQTDKVV